MVREYTDCAGPIEHAPWGRTTTAMRELNITDDQRDRIESLRKEIETVHAGPYASVETTDVIEYLLDLADLVDDPDRSASVGGPRTSPDVDGSDSSASQPDVGGSDPSGGFPREELVGQLEERNLKHGAPEDEDSMDLYTIAAEYDVAGRSDMTKAELIDAILDRAEQLYADPFALVDVEYPAPSDTGVESGDNDPANAPDDDAIRAVIASEADDGDHDSAGVGGDDPEESDVETEGQGDEAGTIEADEGGIERNNDETGADEGGTDDGGAGQLNAMLRLLDTHDDKWREGDGEARYEVDLPDGTVETARTKDDVRALLFKHYR